MVVINIIVLSFCVLTVQVVDLTHTKSNQENKSTEGRLISRRTDGGTRQFASLVARLWRVAGGVAKVSALHPSARLCTLLT